MKKDIKYSKVLKAAFMGGLIAAGLNVAWLYILEFAVNIQGLPKGFTVAVVISSILPLLVGALVYGFLIKSFLKGQMLFYILSVAFAVFSLFPSFQEILPDGNVAPANFALLTVPMHLIAAVVGVYFIVKKSD
ncbi:MAG: hypothetical protein K9H61_05925 [Bacteroidia bacterium]|nr:hypothetical protein [Bacteroidia bacterium]MCF8425262.1 hypothetical protein [Bacteroidia bacterium]MCF8446516.1 hypothetical protein [Bacteroidia bacterium]